MFLPGEFHGRRSLVGYSPWGRKESDTTSDWAWMHARAIKKRCWWFLFQIHAVDAFIPLLQFCNQFVFHVSIIISTAFHWLVVLSNYPLSPDYLCLFFFCIDHTHVYQCTKFESSFFEQEYSTKQLTNLVNVCLGSHINKKARQKLLSAIDDIDRPKR